MSTKTMWAKIGLLSAMALGAAPMWAQETEPASTSTLASIALPQGAVRVSKGSVPAEITDALATMMRSAGAGVRRGRTEVIAWVGGGYSLSKVPRLKSQVGAAFKKGGWTYEEAKPEPGSEGFTMVSALKTAPTRKALIGFWAPDKDALLLAWTEMLPAANAQPEAPAEPEAPADATTEPEAQAEPEVEDAKAKPATVAAPVGATVIEAGAGQLVVNVGKGLPEPRVTFAKLAPLPGKVRGFVKGSDAKPLKGALIGVRSTAVGGAETGAEGKTDAKGYYEISVPFGAAGFYASGYTADYGEGIVALGLRPADGEADEFASPNGHVENWILVPHGIADRAGAQDDPKYVNNYFGGGLILYFHDENSMHQVKKLPFGSTVEITLTPQGPLLDGSKGRAVTIRKPITDGSQRQLYVNNIPVGRYRISGRISGTNRTLHFKESGPDSASAFGLEPKEAQGSADLLLRPLSARAASATAGKGNWKSIDIDVSG